MTRPARIPADVNRPDRVLGPFTARQSVLLTTTAAALYGAWLGLRPWMPLPLFLALAVPVAALAVAVALGQRDGLPLDRFLLAAVRHHLNPRRTHATPPARHGRDGRLLDDDAELDAQRGTTRGATALRPGSAGLLTHADTAGLGPDPAGPGVLDLGPEGLVAIAAVSTLNLGLHTPAEQDALLSGYARYLHTLTGPVQFLIRTVPVDLSAHLTALYEQARTLPHPALVAAALGHRAHLARLAAPTRHGGEADGADELTARQVLLVLREPAAGAGGQRLVRRLEDAIRILATLDIAVTPLDAAQIGALLTDCCNPDRLSSAHPGTGRCDAASMAPVAIARRHPQAELDDREVEELSLAHERAAQPAARRPDTPEAWNQLSGLPTQLGPVDFSLADDVDDIADRDAGPGIDYARHDVDGDWFDDHSLPDHHGRHDDLAGGVGGDDPDGEFGIDEFDPGAAAARWWGQ